MFDSIGIGEMGVVLALAVLLIEPKKLGKVMRSYGQLKRKVSRFQADVKSHLDAIVLEEDAKEKREKLQNDKSSMRKWGKEQAQSIPSTARAEAAEAILKSLSEWPTYKNAKVVSCFAGLLEEVDTEPVLRRILTDGKALLVPYVTSETEGAKSMHMAKITDLEKDMTEGAFGIMEPREALRNGTSVAQGESAPKAIKPDLVLVPGTCFDLRGGRIGKGMGFYDRYLADVKSTRVGLCYDVQITEKNLALDPHDQLMDAVISEKRLLVFSAPRIAEHGEFR